MNNSRVCNNCGAPVEASACRYCGRSTVVREETTEDALLRVAPSLINAIIGKPMFPIERGNGKVWIG